MKKITMFALALGFAAALSAQIRKENVSIYFGTAAHELDAPARQRLDSLLKAAKNWPDYELSIAAYTDDRGTDENNFELAQRRAQSVNDYLKGLQPEKSEVKAAGALALDLQKGSTDQQRAQMRRVDVQITHLTPKNLEDWYQYQNQRQTQHLQIARPDQPQTLQGSKGAKISLPANALRRQDGQPIDGPVTVELREAYTALDMLNQNLSTTSGGRLLQTGGMVYIAAKDASGAALQLADNKAVEIALPQAQRLPEGMQLFVATRPGESTAAPIDWQPVNTPFVQQPRSNSSNTRSLFWFRDLPQRKALQAKNFASIWPKNPLKNPKTNADGPHLPDHNRIKQENPPQANEAPRAYDARIQSLYDAEQRNYRNQRRQTDDAQKQIAAYNNYLDSLHSALRTINAHFERGSAIDDLKTWLENEQLAWRNFSPATIAQTINVLGKDADRPQYAALASRQRQILEKFNALAAEIGSPQKALDLLPKGPTKEIEAFHNTLLDAIASCPSADKLEDLYNSRVKQRAGGVSLEIHCRNFFEQQIPILAKLNQQQLWAPVEPYLASPYAKFVERLKEIDQEYIELCEAYYFRRIELGELSNEQINRALASAVQLGWINCDKFLSYPADACMQLAITHPADDNTQFFVVATEINSLVRMKGNGTQYTTNEYNGLPKEMRAKLVGIRIQTGRVALFVHEDQVQNLAAAKIAFKETTLKEAETVLAGL